MLYPEERIEEKLGFDRIRGLIKAQCSGALGESYVDRMRFSSNFSLIQKLTSQASEFQMIIQRGENYPQGSYDDLSDSLKKATLLGTFLLEEELGSIRRSLIAVGEVVDFFSREEKREEYPELCQLSESLHFDAGLLQDIDRILDEKDRVRSNASPELSRIRQQLRARENGLRSKIDSLLRGYKSEGLAKEDASPTIRDGRLVIPVPAEFKRTVRGMVHDASSTGQTVYIEPQEAVDFNNEVRELQIQERQEIVRILTKVTDRVRPQIPALEKGNGFLGMMDFIRAKAKFASLINGFKPDAVDHPLVEWRKVYHPLLYLAHKSQGKDIIPQSVALDQENRILVISGPNAGGKSIALKTVGLVQYMWQCGLLVPMKEVSRLGIFKSIFIDIGDEQSLDNDLSTYSSHLTNMKHFVHKANKNTLCLIDEFGTGTEPKLGAAIAESILEHLNRKRVYGVITTHYANLKFFADRTDGLINGAMRYDVEALSPLYELEVGQPGSSFAIEIAQKIGLPEAIVGRARNKVGKKEINVERLLSQLESEKKELSDRNDELEKQQADLEKKLSEYTSKTEDLDARKRQLINEAKAEASKIMEKANQKIEMAIKSIKEHKADRIITKQVRHEIERFKDEIKPEKVPESEIAPPTNADGEPKYEVVGGDLKVGDYVKIQGQEAIGQVLELQGKDATISIGELRSNVKTKRLTKVNRKTYRKAQKKSFDEVEQRNNINLTQKIVNFSPKLDVRGKRVEELYPILEEFMDNAIMFEQKNLQIVHGKGTGALRQVVRDHIHRYPEVAQLGDEHPDRGGAGVTLVELL